MNTDCRHQECENPNPPDVCRKCGEWEESGGEPSKRVRELEEVIDGFWEALHYGYNAESREEIEKDARESWAEGTSPLAVALHFVWKREPKVAELTEAFSDLIESILDNVTIEYMDEMTEGKMSIAREALLKYKDKT
jgi:hypothetical protein